MNRRAFLRLSALAPAALAGAGLPASPLRAAGRVLDPAEAELLRAVVERMVDSGGAGAPGPDEVGAVEAIESVLGRLDDAVVDAVRWALWLVDWWPVVGEWRWTRFRALGPAERDASLEGWRTSGLAWRRRAFYALRNLSFLGYWSREQTWSWIGYGGPWLGRRR